MDQRRRCPSALVAPLIHAVRTNRRVHMAVAAKLVPDGRSLLQQHGDAVAGRGSDAVAGRVSDAARASYDTFFHVRRGQVCRVAVAAQLLHRLAQLACDISLHGLDDSGWAPPAEVESIAARRHDLLLAAAEIFVLSSGRAGGLRFDARVSAERFRSAQPHSPRVPEAT
jgi:hypothetical protein